LLAAISLYTCRILRHRFYPTPERPATVHHVSMGSVGVSA
jgi:hypothetical protein